MADARAGPARRFVSAPASRRVRYNVASSLDGFLADANGAFDWIPDEPTIDFAAIFGGVDTVVLGRRSYDTVLATGGGAWAAGTRVIVFSRTLDAAAHPEVEVTSADPVSVVRALRARSGGDIWLFGGGELAGQLLDAGLVDRLEITIAPVLLGAGVPLVSALGGRVTLALVDVHRYPGGMVTLTYEPAAGR